MSKVSRGYRTTSIYEAALLIANGCQFVGASRAASPAKVELVVDIPEAVADVAETLTHCCAHGFGEQIVKMRKAMMDARTKSQEVA